MKTQDIERMAREAGFYVTDTCPLEPEWFHFAGLVATAEREACAKVAETYEAASSMKDAPHIALIFKACAAAIRARKDKQ